jgi:hypothetical protein
MALIDYLKNQIKKTGYPLEIEVSALLDGKWDRVVNTDTYNDKDLGKTRDIDISTYTSWTTENGIDVSVHLAIECKKSDNMAWVFFTRPCKKENLDISGHYIDGSNRMNKSFSTCGVRNYIANLSNFHYLNFSTAAVCFTELYIEGKQADCKNGEIFEAINQIKKYVLDKKIITMYDEDYPIFIDLHFPCIVFDGKMFEAQIRNGLIDLNERKHIILQTSEPALRNRSYLNFIIDIVHKDYFKTYLELIEANIRELNNRIKRKDQLLCKIIGQKGGATDAEWAELNGS